MTDRLVRRAIGASGRCTCRGRARARRPVARTPPPTRNVTPAHSAGSDTDDRYRLRQRHVLVDADWAQAHLNDPNVRFVEVDVDTTAYEQSHIPGAVGWNWTSQLSDGIRRDIASPRGFLEAAVRVGHRARHDDRPLRRQQQLVRGLGVLAAQAVRPRGRPDPQRRAQVLARQRPAAHHRRAVATRPPATSCRRPTTRLRAFATTSCRAWAIEGLTLVDVRCPAEFNGEVIAPPGMSETAQRAGRIPGAISVRGPRPSARTARSRAADELRALYEGKGVTPDKDVIAYCRIGERCSHTLVRAPRAARLPAGPQLRRLVDRVGQHGRRPDREAGAGRRRLATAWHRGPGSAPFRHRQVATDGPAVLACRGPSSPAARLSSAR